MKFLLNYWYFWQADQELLADDRFANTDEFYTFLNNYSSSEDLFDDLIYQPGVVDDFSWYIEDVEEMYVDPPDDETTPYGKIPQKAEKGTLPSPYGKPYGLVYRI